jgi:hypothetical protein
LPPSGAIMGRMPDNEDLNALLAELKTKGYSASQIKAVTGGWEAACHEGAHGDLAEAAHAAVDDLAIQRLMSQGPSQP